jgi:5-methylcytosine-specific restriction endonuclease McrA
MNEEKFSVDHSQPLARNGAFTLENLTVCCKSCNTAKGILTCDEFTQLSQLARSWPDCAANNLFGRLKAGGRIIRGL